MTKQTDAKYRVGRGVGNNIMNTELTERGVGEGGDREKCGVG